MILSVLFHATILALGLGMLGRGTISGAPQRYIEVTLLNDERSKQQTAADSREESLPLKSPVTRKMPATKKKPAATKKTGRASLKVSPAVPPKQEQPSTPPADSGYITGNKADPTSGNPSGISGPHQTNRAADFSWSPYGTMRFEGQPGSSDITVTDDGDNDKSGGETLSVSLIRTAIEKSVRYPVRARERGIEGTVIAEFGIDDRGLPRNLRILQSSGWDVLDSAALDTVVRASPFPVVKGKIEIPITFRLKSE